MTHGWDDAHKHLSQCRVTHHYKCRAVNEKKVTCEVYWIHEVSDNAVALLSQRAHPLPSDTFSVLTIMDGYARARWPQHLFTLPLLRPDCTLSRLTALYDWR